MKNVLHDFKHLQSSLQCAVHVPAVFSASLNPSFLSVCWLCISASPCPVLLASFFFFYPCLPAINPLVTLFSPLQTHAVSCFPETPVLILQHTTKQDGNRERRRERGRDQIKSQTHKLKTLRELTFVGFQSLIWKTVALLQQHKVPQLKKRFQLCYTAQHDCKYYPISSDIPLLFTLRTTALWGNEKKSNPKENLVCSESV